ncbi:MAG: filamentous hemagglutinin N-terminal domain-containing protein [Phascolarctobacterium sp.]|nr:filamentous hemagglutinin N-terminal domain-containing protein [Phascolarctobacterium sp.]
MKLNRIVKKSLSATVAFWIMSGCAYAMPTGGSVVSGNVTNVNNPAAIMAAKTHSIINWDTFNIAKNEKVIFDTNTFNILNRVVGGQESLILGMLKDQGKGHLIIMNPAGIVVGPNAVIDANKLTLTSLKITESDFNNLINGGSIFYEGDNDSIVRIDKGSKINVNKLLEIYGGKITIADGVEIVSKNYGESAVNILGSDSIRVTPVGNTHAISATGSGNVDIGKAVIGNEEGALTHLDIRGKKISINGMSSIVDDTTNSNKRVTRISGSDVNVLNSNIINKSGDMVVVASSTWESSVDLVKFTSQPDQTDRVTISNTSLDTNKGDISILGADANIYGSNITSGKNLIVGGVKKYGNVEGVMSAETYDTSTVNVDDATNVRAAGKSTVYGAILNVNWNKFDQTLETKNPFITIQGKDNVTIDEILERMRNSKNKEEMQRILNIIQSAGGEVIVIGGDKNKFIVTNINRNPKYEKIIEEISQKYSNEDGNKVQKFEELKDIKNNYKEKALDTYLENQNEIIESVSNMFNFVEGFTENDQSGLLGEMAGLIKELNDWQLNLKKYKSGEYGSAKVTEDATAILEKSNAVLDKLEKCIYDLPKDKQKGLLLNSKFKGGFSVLSETLGLISSIAAATEGVDKKNNANIVADYISAGKDITKVGKSVYELKDFGSGVYSNAAVYSALISSSIEGIAQTIRSVDTYTEDGRYTAQEIGFTAIDVGCAMLYEITHALSFHLDDVIFSAIQKASGKETELTYAQQAAEGFKNLSVMLNHALFTKNK